jgi:glycine hydroxymethyltransferase
MTLEFEHIKNEDKEIYDILMAEKERQQNCLELIASENFTSKAVMEAAGSYHTNKYAEGYPGARYYAGCINVDKSEQLAIDRAKKLFGAEHINVQSHSGAQANEAVYIACLKKGDKVLTMTLNSGAHITHMSPATAQSRFYEPIYYDVNQETYLIDYNKVEELALKNLPRLVICGASAYPRTIDFSRFREIVNKVNEKKRKLITEEEANTESYWEDHKCLLMCDMAHIAGLVATGLHPSPVPYCDFVTSTTHKTLRGTRGGIILCKQEWAKKIDLAVFPRLQGGGLQHIIAAKAITFGEALKPEFKEYQEQVVKNAKVLAEELIKYGFNVLTGGTDNHLILLDLRNKGITGKELEERLDNVGITVNKNAVPFDTEKKTITSGIRLGTPALTTRGFKEEDMKKVADLIRIMALPYYKEYEEFVKIKVGELCKAHPLYE